MRTERSNDAVAMTFGVLLALGAQIHAAEAAEKWLACAGTLTTVEQSDAKTEPSERVLAYNDEYKALFQWQQNRKALSLIPTVSYNSEQIDWGKRFPGFSGPYWEGRLDRRNMSLKIERTEGNPDGTVEKMTWVEKCAPTQPLDGSAPAVASSQPSSTFQ